MSKPKPKCETCQRGERFFEGCSHGECPKRKLVTAAPQGSRGATSVTALGRIKPSIADRFDNDQ